MKKKKYDLAFGLGSVCSCSQTLRGANLQFLSFPGDWTSPIGNYPMPASHLHVRTDWLLRGFDNGFFNREDLQFLKVIERENTDAYVNRRTNYFFNHDFPHGAALDEVLPSVKAKYNQRRNRLFSIIEKSRRVLVLRLDYPDGTDPTSLDDCAYARRRLQERFPGVQFDIALMQPDPGRPFASRLIDHPEPWLTRIRFDYHGSPAAAEAYLYPDLDLTSKALSELYCVRDYRTFSERLSVCTRKLRKSLGKRIASLRRLLHIGDPA